MFTVDDALELLNAAEVFFDLADVMDPSIEPPPEGYSQVLNLNDTWGWACADAEYVPDDCLPELAWLFWRYGWAGILYWVWERRGRKWTAFRDNNRMIEFVRQEEALRARMSRGSERAQYRLIYTLGEEPPTTDPADSR